MQILRERFIFLVSDGFVLMNINDVLLSFADEVSWSFFYSNIITDNECRSLNHLRGLLKLLYRLLGIFRGICILFKFLDLQMMDFKLHFVITLPLDVEANGFCLANGNFFGSELRFN